MWQSENSRSFQVERFVSRGVRNARFVTPRTFCSRPTRLSSLRGSQDGKRNSLERPLSVVVRLMNGGQI
eukprot:2356779-Pyramimonas_sp.AAC.1